MTTVSHDDQLTSPRLEGLIERRQMIDTAIGQMYELKNLVVDEILRERSRLYSERQTQRAAEHYAGLAEQAQAEARAEVRWPPRRRGPTRAQLARIGGYSSSDRHAGDLTPPPPGPGAGSGGTTDA